MGVTTTVRTAPAHRRRDSDRLPTAVLALTGLCGTGLCVAAASRVRLTDIGDLGLATVLGPAYWIGLLLLNAAFAAGLLTTRPARWVAPLLTLGLVVAIYGAAPIATGEPRGEVTWRHIGIVDTLERTGHVDPSIDAYFNWPGYFALLLAFSQATGLSLVALGAWAPVWNNILWLTAVGAMARQLTTDRRQVWLAVWLFASANWIDQDYLSPQAFAYLVFLTAIAVVLRWLRTEPVISLPGELRRSSRPRQAARAIRRWWELRVPAPTVPAAGARRLGVLAVVVLLAVAITASHQLTPFALLAAVGALVVTGRCVSVRLPLILTVIVVCWLTYPAAAYLAGHPIAPGRAHLSGVTAANVTDRLDGSPSHVLVGQIRVAIAGTVWALASIGAWISWRTGRRPATIMALTLAAAPFVLPFLQSYGGEVLFRVVLFSLPFSVLLGAMALLPRPGTVLDRTTRVVTAVACTIACTVLGSAVVLARYGNARFDMFPPTEIAAVERMYQEAQPGDVLIAGAHPTPWRYRDYEKYKATTVQDLCPPGTAPAACASAIVDRTRRAPAGNGLMLLTRSNYASLRMQGRMTVSDLTTVESTVGAAPGVRLVYVNRDARLYRIAAR